MAFQKQGAPEKQQVILAEEENEQNNGEVVDERELDTELVPEDDNGKEAREES